MSEDKKVELKKVAELIAMSIKDLTKEELEEVLKILKDEYGLEPAEPEVVTVTAEEAVEEKSSFNVILKSFGGNKMHVIKAWKTLSSKTLTEAKNDVTAAPITLKEAISKEEAEMLKEQLEAAGAEVELA